MHQATSLTRAANATPWLNAERVRAWSFIYSAIAIATIAIYLIGTRNGVDFFGRPIGADFASFWTAARLAFEGAPASAWSVETHYAAQRAAFGPDAPYAAFFYPPPYLLVCLPLALAPYGSALCVWLAATGAAWLHMARAWVRGTGAKQLGWTALLSFPAVLVNAGHGQNGFLTAALFGLGALLHQRRPWLAGALFGCLVIKPHLAVLVPIFLIVTGNWRAFLSAAVTAMGLCLVAFAAFGPDAWHAFFAASSLARATLDQGLVDYGKMQSLFAAARMMGASAATAWFAQIFSAIICLVCLWRIRRATPEATGASLVCATLLTTPFLLDYDLTILIVPLVWLLAEAQSDAFRPGERLVLFLGAALPLLSRPIAIAIHVPVAPIIFLLMLHYIIRRADPPTRPRHLTSETRP